MAITPMRAGIVATLALLQLATAPAQAESEAPTLRLAFQEIVDLAADEDGGSGPKGGRNRIALLGGLVSGPRLSGTILPGGADWQLVRADGCAEIVANYFIKASDGALIQVTNTGLGCAPDGKRGLYLHANPVFDAPNGPHDWLNRSVFTSVIEELPAEAGKPRQIKIRFYEIE